MMKIVLVEDCPSQRAILEEIIQGSGDLFLTGVYDSAESAWAGADWRLADVLVADLALPGESGVELIQKVKARHPSLRCLALTMHGDSATTFAALEAGVDGYLLKGGPAAELLESIREVAMGLAPLSPQVSRYLIQALRGESTEHWRANLTSRELQLLRLMADGKSYKEMAAALNISPHTVNAHVRNMYGKLDASGRREALQRARLLGYLIPRMGT